MATRSNIKELLPQQCIAWSKQAQRRCRRYATPGWNVCKIHGSRGGKMPVHGMYSSKVNVKLQERYEEFLEHTDTLETLTSDIALMRAMMCEVLDTDIGDNEEAKQYRNGLFLRYMKDIRDASALKSNIEDKFSVSIETVQIFLNQVMFMLKKHIEDEDTLFALVNDLRKIKLLDENNPQIRGRLK